MRPAFFGLQTLPAEYAELPPSDWSTSEVHYFSDHMNGIYNYYHFAINAGETKVFTIGFFVDEVLLENGELLLPVNSGQGYIQILAMEPE